MKFRITLTFLLAAFAFFSLDAQVIWGGPGDPNGEFDGGLNDWTTVGLTSFEQDSAKNSVWVWDADASPSEGAYAGDDPLDSPSAANGAAFFNSDFLDNGGVQGAFRQGLSPSPHSGYLQSPIIDCSGHESVVLTFFQDYRNFQSSASIEVSIDGGMNFDTSFSATPEVFVNDALALSESLARFDISDVASNESNVVIRFVFSGDYYYWMIDDVALIERPALDIKVGDIFFSAENIFTPVSQVDAVNHEFGMDVINLGSEPQKDLELAVRITDSDVNTLFTDTIMLDSIGLRDTIFVEFDTIVNAGGTAFGEEGDFILIYDFLSDSADFSDRDNIAFERFSISSDFYSKSNTRLQFWNFGDGLVGNYYETGSWEDAGNGSFIANELIIAATDGEDDGDATIAELTATIFRVNDDVEEDFSNFDFTADPTIPGEHPSLTPVGYAFESIEGDDRDFFTLNLIDFESDEPGIVLEPNSRYFYMIQQPEGTFFFGFDRYVDFFQVSTVSYSADDQFFFLAGGGEDFSMAATVNMAFASSTQEVTLPETTLNVYPNPTTEQYTVELDFETATDVTLLLTSVDGKILKMENLSKVTNLQKQYNVANLASGTYVVRVLTDEGVRNQKLVIQK